MRTVASLSLFLLLAAGCVSENPAYDPNPLLPDECREGAEVSETFASFGRPEKLDILFVVDGSGDGVEALLRFLVFGLLRLFQLHLGLNSLLPSRLRHGVEFSCGEVQ